MARNRKFSILLDHGLELVCGQDPLVEVLRALGFKAICLSDGLSPGKSTKAAEGFDAFLTTKPYPLWDGDFTGDFHLIQVAGPCVQRPKNSAVAIKAAIEETGLAEKEDPCLLRVPFTAIHTLHPLGIGRWCNFSVPIKPEELERAYGLGMLRKDQLEDGKYYFGYCRNARVARYSAVEQGFTYRRWKGAWRNETLKHPEDDDANEHFQIGEKWVGIDLFQPFLRVAPMPEEEV